MSNEERVEAACPNCSEEQSVIVWTSLNATLNPEAKQDLLEKRINLLECEKCGTNTQIHLRMFYHDMEKEFCVILVPFSTIIDGNLAFEFNKYGELGSENDSENEMNINKPYDYMKYIHPIFDMEELIRYILFRDSLFEDYKQFQVTARIREKLLDVRDKTRSGEIDTGGKPYFIKPEDLL